MRVKKKLFAVITALTLLLGATACGGGAAPGSGEPPSQSPQAGETTNSTETPPPAEETADYITIQGEQYRTDLTRLFLNTPLLTDADIAPLRYMTRLTELQVAGRP
jgi:hypothetical protein